MITLQRVQSSTISLSFSWEYTMERSHPHSGESFLSINSMSQVLQGHTQGSISQASLDLVKMKDYINLLITISNIALPRRRQKENLEWKGDARSRASKSKDQLAFFASCSVPIYHREFQGTLSSVTCRSFDVSNVLRGILGKESACLKRKKLNYLLLKYVDPHVERTSLQPQVPNEDVQEPPRVPEMNLGTGCILGVEYKSQECIREEE